MSHVSINTDIDSNIFQDTYIYPEWFNKKKYIFYNKTLERLQNLSDLHTKASQYFDKMHYYIIGPSIVITALSGIASFLSTSQYIDTNTQNAFGISVGIAASFASVLQSISGACQYSAKKEAHRTVAEEYNKLIVVVKFEIEMPNEEDFTDNLEKQILDIQNKCNYFIPQFIIDKYNKQKQKKLITQKKQIKIPGSVSGVINKNPIVINIDDINKSNEELNRSNIYDIGKISEKKNSINGDRENEELIPKDPVKIKLYVDEDDDDSSENMEKNNEDMLEKETLI